MVSLPDYDANQFGRSSNDERLNRIWQTGAYTVHLNMQDYLWDGIKRDRLVWIGDMGPETMTVLSVFGNQDIQIIGQSTAVTIDCHLHASCLRIDALICQIHLLLQLLVACRHIGHLVQRLPNLLNRLLTRHVLHKAVRLHLHTRTATVMHQLYVLLRQLNVGLDFVSILFMKLCVRTVANQSHFAVFETAPHLQPS